MAKARKSGKLGRKLDKVLFGIPENRAKFMRTGRANSRAGYRRRLYRVGHAAALKNPGDPGAALRAIEGTTLFRDACSVDGGGFGGVASAREFFLAGYHDGMGERGNPKARSAFDRCVQSVAAKGGAYDPRAVCAAAGRAKYGQREMTRRSVAGKRRKARGNPESWQKIRGYEVEGSGYTSRTLNNAKRFATLNGYDTITAYDHHGNTVRTIRVKLPKGKRNPRNPLDTAQSAYEGFHGEPSRKTIVVQEKRHFHTHVWALGPLVYLKVHLPSDRRKQGYKNTVDLEFDYEGAHPVLVTANEKRNQMFFDGGDQSVDLKVFSVPPEPHETVVLGEVSDAWYFTTKKHLGKDGGTAIYKHKLGEEGGELPTLIYHTLEKRLSLAGGSYTIPNEGVRN